MCYDIVALEQLNPDDFESMNGYMDALDALFPEEDSNDVLPDVPTFWKPVKELPWELPL